MKPDEVLSLLNSDEREAFFSMTALDDPENLAGETFAAALEFGDPGSIRDLRLILCRIARDREFTRAVEVLRSFTDGQDERGLRCRRALRDLTSVPLPEPAHLFVDSLSALIAGLLHGSRGRAGRRRTELVRAILDEARSIEAGRAA